MEPNLRRAAIALCLGFAFLHAPDVRAQNSETRKVSLTLGAGAIFPSGKELADVFDAGFIIEPALRKEFAAIPVSVELAFSSAYVANRYSENATEARDNVWLYGPSVNVLYGIPVFRQLRVYPKVGAGYLFGDNYLTPKGKIFKDKEEAMHSKGFSFNVGLHFEYDRWCFTALYVLHKPNVTPDKEVKSELGSYESKLYGDSFTLDSQKMNFNHLRFTIGLKLNQQ